MRNPVWGPGVGEQATSPFRQQALFFHPQAAKALRLQVQLREAPPREKETVGQKMAKEEASLQAIAAMQGGAHDVPNAEARGAAVLRHLDMGKFEGYLKRKYEADEGSKDKWQQIAMAQTSLDANRKFQEERGAALALSRETLQSGSLCEAQLDYLMGRTSVLPNLLAWTSRRWSRTRATLPLCSWRKFQRRNWTSMRPLGGLVP